MSGTYQSLLQSSLLHKATEGCYEDEILSKDLIANNAYNRVGVASVFTPNLGIVHECNLLLLRLFELVDLLVVHPGCLYLAAGTYWFVDLLLVQCMN
jgi:hypothetical protein